MYASGCRGGLPLLAVGALDADEEGVEGHGVIAQKVVQQQPQNLEVLHHLSTGQTGTFVRTSGGEEGKLQPLIAASAEI